MNTSPLTTSMSTRSPVIGASVPGEPTSQASPTPSASPSACDGFGSRRAVVARVGHAVAVARPASGRHRSAGGAGGQVDRPASTSAGVASVRAVAVAHRDRQRVRARAPARTARTARRHGHERRAVERAVERGRRAGCRRRDATRPSAQPGRRISVSGCATALKVMSSTSSVGHGSRSTRRRRNRTDADLRAPASVDCTAEAARGREPTPCRRRSRRRCALAGATLADASPTAAPATHIETVACGAAKRITSSRAPETRERLARRPGPRRRRSRSPAARRAATRS